jgi:hypothetical protein
MPTAQTTEKAEAHTAQKSAQHTPGPWTVHPASPRKVIDTTGTVIASCGRVEKVPDSIYANYLANARLIAAAPELLEACKQMVGMMEAEDGGISISMRPIYNSTKLTIAKAEKGAL